MFAETFDVTTLYRILAKFIEKLKIIDKLK